MIYNDRNLTFVDSKLLTTSVTRINKNNMTVFINFIMVQVYSEDLREIYRQESSLNGNFIKITKKDDISIKSVSQENLQEIVKFPLVEDYSKTYYAICT